ncbi:MAG TPA: DNA-processing protein DprA [Acidimicrobiales bacterium]|nr:DNA-processing protein DprA [Acidimicrobiales bacterium]
MSDDVWSRDDPRLPGALAADPDPPQQLYVRGDPSALELRRVAIVGTRNCTAYGRTFARRLGTELAEAGVAVVSGLAIGIDGAAHEGVLDARGVPIGVVATGLDVVYPRRHRSLWDRVARSGLLVSEEPPHTRPTQWGFPRRNRIIAALSEIVVVVESSAKGGSMHTVDAALARGINVMAVPGPVGAVTSDGTNRLLVDGVPPVTCTDDVLLALGLETSRRSFELPAPRRSRLSARARAVLDVLDFVPMPTDALIEASGFTRGEVLVALQELAAARQAEGGGGWWHRMPTRR